MINKLAKILVRKSGGYMFGPGSVPKGLDLYHDIRRYGWLTQPCNILDVGANVGQFASATLAALPDSKIWSLEPVSSSFTRLQSRSADVHRWKTHRAAVGSHIGTVKVTADPCSTMNHVIMNDYKSNYNYCEEVPLITVDKFICDQGIESIAMLKTDTEGYDLEVLLGAQNAISSSIISSVLCEVCFKADDIGHTSFHEVCSLLCPQFVVAGFYGQGCDAPLCEIDRVDALFINTSHAP